MKTIAQSLLLFAVASYGFAEDVVRESQTDDIREAVFRWQFEYNASIQQKKAQVYCIGIGENNADPSNEFMKRFADHKPSVRKTSACSANADMGVREKKTGEKGLMFIVIRMKWNSDEEVEVEGGYYEHGLSSSGNTYIVKKMNGKWTLTSDRMDWIS